MDQVFRGRHFGLAKVEHVCQWSVSVEETFQTRQTTHTQTHPTHRDVAFKRQQKPL